MTRSRLTLSVDQPNRIFTIRYIGAIDGDDINDSLLSQVSQVERPWEYDSIMDLRRHDGTVMAADIEDLGLRWSLLAKGRDQGRLTAIISEDPLVSARLSQSQAVFPHRTLCCFARLEDGVAWIQAQREHSTCAAAG